jgi:hypothetical protein
MLLLLRSSTSIRPFVLEDKRNEGSAPSTLADDRANGISRLSDSSAGSDADR